MKITYLILFQLTLLLFYLFGTWTSAEDDGFKPIIPSESYQVNRFANPSDSSYTQVEDSDFSQSYSVPQENDYSQHHSNSYSQNHAQDYSRNHAQDYSHNHAPDYSLTQDVYNNNYDTGKPLVIHKPVIVHKPEVVYKPEVEYQRVVIERPPPPKPKPILVHKPVIKNVPKWKLVHVPEVSYEAIYVAAADAHQYSPKLQPKQKIKLKSKRPSFFNRFFNG